MAPMVPAFLELTLSITEKTSCLRWSIVTGQLEHMCLLDKPIRVILCEEKASSKGREMMPPPKLSIIMANLFFLI